MEFGMSEAKKLTCLACGAVNKVPVDKLAAAPKCGVCGDALMGGKVREVDFATLQKAAKKDDVPLVADLWAPWCGPCRTMAPEFSKAAQELRDQVRFVKINTDTHQKALSVFNVRSIPTMIMFRRGKESARQSGAMRAPEIVKWTRARAM